MSSEIENNDLRSAAEEKKSIPSRSNVEHTSESERIIQEDRDKLSQSGFGEPRSPRSGERDASSGVDNLAPGLAGKPTP